MKQRVLNHQFVTTILTLSIFSIILCLNSCDNDELFELDTISNHSSSITRSCSIDTSTYLTLNSYNIEEWTNNDIKTFGKAIDRIGIQFSEQLNKYTYKANNGKEINISDSLFNKIISMFEHTNKILSKYSKFNGKNKVVRRKVMSGDVSGDIPDCVPAAISNMGINAPSYAAAINKCNQLFPNWYNRGGVPLDSIQFFIEKYTQVSRYHNLSFCNSAIGQFPNIVMVWNTGPTFHAVNACNYVKSQYSTIISYHDISSSSQGDGTIQVSQLVDIYPFINNN